MTSISRSLRNSLESTVTKARGIAEAAASEALTYLGVADVEKPKHLKPEQHTLRNQLRAHARQLGDRLVAGAQDTKRLAEEIAYEQWHRILFTRFLAENHLLIHPELQDAISFSDCEEIAAEQGKTGWDIASEYASYMLPQIFRQDAPTLRIQLSTDRLKELETLVNDLNHQTFLAKDSLGWTYQFWQAKKKDEINASGMKIGAVELPAVTQLFTEDYMVEFLLHNSLGAWWVSNCPDKPLPVGMPYLRFIDEEVVCENGAKRTIRRPAAGRFQGLPRTLKDFKLLDPCCGSGHFLVFALMLLVPMRMELEGMSAKVAVDAVLRENLHGLELDARCVEIAVFALALAAWTYPETGGYRKLPELNIACCGLAITQKEADWLRLANGDDRLREGMRSLYRVFKDAPTLGSLIDPRKALADDLLTAKFEELVPLLEKALGEERIRSSDEATEVVLTARGLLQAAKLLLPRYSLVITNPPYLAWRKFDEILRIFVSKHYSRAKAEIANVFVERLLRLTSPNGTLALVTPQNWLFQSSYKEHRNFLLSEKSIRSLTVLGAGAFDTISGEIVKAILMLVNNSKPASVDTMSMFSVATLSIEEKRHGLTNSPATLMPLSAQLSNEGYRILSREGMDIPLLNTLAEGLVGVMNGDSPKYQRSFWELIFPSKRWVYQQTTVDCSNYFSGFEKAIDYVLPEGHLRADANYRRSQLHDSDQRGRAAWGKRGVAVSAMGSLPVSLYLGHVYDSNVAVILPKNEAVLPAIWCYCVSSTFHDDVREIDQALKVTNSTLVQVPFDRRHWQQVAAEQYPNGLPKPYSDDPTQWIFHGHPQPSSDPLQVAVARLLDYTWPAESDEDIELSEEGRAWVTKSKALNMLANNDGIVCIPSVKGERPAEERLLAVLAHAWSADWSPGIQAKLLADSGAEGRPLEFWLRNLFFAQHCTRFHNRPFIWHVWDGQKDGFSALVNYHKLTNAKLESLTYSYLGDWITQQERKKAARVDGAEILLDAARALQAKLKLILAGEARCDIFVRWKALEDLPVSWDPDLNDGVRMNIRPFLLAGDVGKRGAGVLRDRPNIKWTKDRGTDVPSAPWFDLGPRYGEDKGARINDHHTSLEDKKKARAGKA